MKTRPELIVVDTCVYVDALYTGNARSKETDEVRAQRSSNLLAKIDKGEFLAGLLPIVLTEINSSRQLGSDVPSKTRHERKKAIDAYFNGYGHITLEHDNRVAELGAKLARQELMKAPDALVVASAVVHEAYALFSWDKKILSLQGNGLVKKLKISEPPKMIAPAQGSIFELIDEKSLQMDFLEGINRGNHSD